MKIYKKEIVVDITDLPDKIRELIWDENDGVSNNSYTKYYVHGEQKPRKEHTGKEILFEDKSCDYIVEKGDNPISDYFYGQGLKNREEIIILLNW
jgi:hypothetical protein